MATIDLTEEQEALVRAALEWGRFADPQAVVDAGLRLVHAAERQRAALTASLEAAYQEAERDGWLTLEEVEAALDADERTWATASGPAPEPIGAAG